MDAVKTYHALLENDTLAQDSCAALYDGQREEGLVFGDHPLSVAIRPQLLDRRRYEAAATSSQAIYGALRSLERELCRDAELRAELDLSSEEEELALAEPPGGTSSPTSRLDGFYTDELRYVEYNAETPAGQAYSDNLTKIFEKLPVMRAFRKQFRIRGFPIRPRLLSTLLRSFKRWGRDDTPVISIVDWTGLPTVAEFEMFRDYFESKGIKTVICDPRALEYRGGKLYASGKAVNLVYRRVLTSELVAGGDETKALRRAYLDGAVCVVNTFRAKFLHKKMSLALLSDDRYDALYTPEQRRVIARHVPWTRKMADGATTYQGKAVKDLAKFVCQNRTKLVLKPNDEYGGKGVVLGWTVDDHEWEQDVEVALTQSYVVQEAVGIPREQFPVALDGIHFLDLSMDMDPYLFDGRVSGNLSRLSSSALLNVTAGAGSVIPTYIVEGARD